MSEDYAPEMDDDVLTLEEAAKRLRVSYGTAKTLAARGEFPGATRVGRQYRVSARALDRHLHGAE